MDDKEMARLLGLMRVALGAALFLAPHKVARLWTGEHGEEAVSTMALQGQGARDLGLGLGLLIALENGHSPRHWLEAGAIADTADAFATLGQWGRLSFVRKVGLLGLELGAAALGLRLAAEVE